MSFFFITLVCCLFYFCSSIVFDSFFIRRSDPAIALWSASSSLAFLRYQGAVWAQYLWVHATDLTSPVPFQFSSTFSTLVIRFERRVVFRNTDYELRILYIYIYLQNSRIMIKTLHLSPKQREEEGGRLSVADFLTSLIYNFLLLHYTIERSVC